MESRHGVTDSMKSRTAVTAYRVRHGVTTDSIESQTASSHSMLHLLLHLRLLHLRVLHLVHLVPAITRAAISTPLDTHS